MKVDIEEAASMSAKYLKAGLVPFLTSSPGCGKSQLFYQLAKVYGLKVIDLRLAQCDPTDLSGFPAIQDGKAGYMPMNTFPLEDDLIPEGYLGWLLFMDEFNSAATAVQAAAYKLVLDRMIGQHRLHKKVAIACAGNLETDNAIVNEMSTALQSRLVHMELELSVPLWLKWAELNGIHHWITDWIRFKNDALYTFKPDHTDRTYACPRTWEFVNRLMPHREDPDFLKLAAGAIAEGNAREFVTFFMVYDRVPKIEQIILHPDTVFIPEELDVMWTTCGTLANRITMDNGPNIMKYLRRMPKEFSMVCVREMVSRNRSILKLPAVRNFVQETSLEVFVN